MRLDLRQGRSRQLRQLESEKKNEREEGREREREREKNRYTGTKERRLESRDGIEYLTNRFESLIVELELLSIFEYIQIFKLILSKRNRKGTLFLANHDK